MGPSVFNHMKFGGGNFRTIFRDDIDKEMLLLSKQAGMSDKQIGGFLKTNEDEVRGLRKKHGILPWVKQVESCVVHERSKFKCFSLAFCIYNNIRDAGLKFNY